MIPRGFICIPVHGEDVYYLRLSSIMYYRPDNADSTAICTASGEMVYTVLSVEEIGRRIEAATP
jgi:hypothetical protein